MATYLRPGVYVEETLNPIAPVVGVNSTSVAAFIGASDRGPETPTLVNSWSEYVSLYGSWNVRASNDLPIAVLLFFSNGGSQAYIKRVVVSTDTATRTLFDTSASTLTVDAINPGKWGNDIALTVVNNAATDTFDLIVYYKGTAISNIVERYTDLTMTTTAERYAVSVINAQSKYITTTDEGSINTGAARNPVNITAQNLAGVSSDGAVSETDISGVVNSFDTVLNSLVLNAPGVTEDTAVNELIDYAEAREDIFVVVDGIDDTVTNQLVASNTYSVSSYAAVYYPRITIKDPTVTTPNVTKLVAPGGAIVGKVIATDTARGVFKAPAGLQTRLATAVSVKQLTNAELDSLNSDAAPVNAIRFIAGSGIVVMGSRTLKGGYVDRYIPVRRTLIYLRKSLSDLTQFAVFEPNDQRLWRQLSSVVSGFLTDFWQQGGLRGDNPAQAFFVKCDAETNTTESIDAGEVRLEVGVALQRPAEFVVIKIGQFDGGTTVTVA